MISLLTGALGGRDGPSDILSIAGVGGSESESLNVVSRPKKSLGGSVGVPEDIGDGGDVVSGSLAGDRETGMSDPNTHPS